MFPERIDLSEEACLVAPTRVDAGRIATLITDDPDIAWWITSMPWPYTVDDGRAFVELAQTSWLHRSDYMWLFHAESHGPVGGIGLHPRGGGTAEIGFWLTKRFRGKGLVSSAVRELISLSTENEIHTMTWAAVAGNTGSALLARATGFRFDGTRQKSVPSPPIRGAAEGTLVDAWTGSRPTLGPPYLGAYETWSASGVL